MINSQWAKKFSKVHAKKLVYSNESIQQNIYFSWIPIFHNSFFYWTFFKIFIPVETRYEKNLTDDFVIITTNTINHIVFGLVRYTWSPRGRSSLTWWSSFWYIFKRTRCVPIHKIVHITKNHFSRRVQTCITSGLSDQFLMSRWQIPTFSSIQKISVSRE